MSRLGWTNVASAVLVLAAASIASPRAASAPGGVLKYDEVVRISVNLERAADKLAVEPEVAVIPPKGALTWEVAGLPKGYTLEVDFRVTHGRKGPFQKAATRGSVRGRYAATLDGKIPSNAADQGSGYWKYDVVLRNEAGEDVSSLDPGVLIKN